MKKFLDIDLGLYAVITCLLVFLASCQPYDNSIQGTTVTPGSFVPTYDSAGTAIGTHQVQDTTYLVSPTWAQAWAWSGQRNDRIWFWIGLGILVFASAGFIIYNNSGSAGQGSVIPLMIAIVVSGCLMGGSLEWEKSGMQQEIQKTQYDALMKDPGNLGPFWDTIRIK